MLTIERLLSLGYFCEELPPPFVSNQLGKKYKQLLPILGSIPKKDKLWDTLCVDYIAPKVGIHRRNLSIPNPYPQIKLSEIIISKWPEIESHYKKSTFSISRPQIDKDNKRAITYLNRFELFKESCIKAAASKHYRLTLDIAKYFPSIYTHSIPWALHGKDAAKKDRTSKLWGNTIDFYMRASNSNQTKGVPIGTDTSRIIAEIIGCEIDYEFIQWMKKYGLKVDGYRFVDDCKFFFDNLSDAEKALKEYQKILNQYSLNLNDEKTSIHVIPFRFDNSWKCLINALPLSSTNSKAQRTHLKNYFNQLIHEALNNPKDSVIKYGIKKLLRLNVYSTNIDIFEPLLFNLVLCEPVILPDLALLLYKHGRKFSRRGVENFISSMLNRNIHNGHHFEVSWTLWIAKCWRIKISKPIAQTIIDSKDVISTVILLDMYTKNLIEDLLDFSDLLLDLDSRCLFNDLWLLGYEAEYHKWLPLKNIKLSPFYSELRRKKINFYNSDIDLNVYSSAFKPKLRQTLKKKLEQQQQRFKSTIEEY